MTNKKSKQSSPSLSVLPVFFDLETTNLNANYGRLICGSVKAYGQPPVTFRIDETPIGKLEPWNDSQLAVLIRDALEGEFQIYGYNSVMFDMKYLDSRLMIHKERPTRRPMHKDLMFVAKSVFAFNSVSLKSVQEALGLVEEKTRLDPMEWVQAATGHKPAIDYVVEHCEKDVMVLEEVFTRLAPFIHVIYK